jgi:GNAT superfamily N-acetyltransferase
MFQAGDNTPIGSFRRALEAYSIMVDEVRGRLKGFVGTREAEPGERDIRVYVNPAHRRRGVGRRLFEVGMERLKGSGRVTAKYRVDAGGGGGAFYAGRGFRVWYGMDELIYRGGRRPDLAGSAPASAPTLDIRPYDDRHFEAYVRLVGDAFEPMRRSHDFRPHNVREMNSTPERRDYFLAHRDDIFLAFGEGVLVGEAAVEGDFIDEIGVAPGHQGQGYGRLLTLFCLDLLLRRGHPHPRTSVVVGNGPAWDMYYRLGFELVQTNEWACRRSGSAGAGG